MRPQTNIDGWNFFKITLEDICLFDYYMEKTPWPINLWSANFPYLWAYSQEPHKKVLWKIVDGLLVPFLFINKKLVLLCLPFGQGNVENLIAVLYKCLKFCANWNGSNCTKTKIRMINQSQLEFLKTSEDFNKYFSVVEMKGIEKHYSIPLLIALEGKDFKSLRKKISRYHKKYPDIKIRKYKPGDYENLLVFNSYWEETAGQNYKKILDKVYFKEIIRHNRELNHIVFIAELSEKVVGMIAGGELPTGQAWISLGKADKNFEGLSELLHLKLISEIYKRNNKIELINSGGDLASEGLKSFKEKFKPILSLKRYKVFLS